MNTMNAINALMYIPIPFLVVMTLGQLCRKTSPYGVVLALHALCALLVSTMFVCLQVLWIIENRDDELPPFEVIGWIVHDFTSAIFFLASTAGGYLIARVDHG